MPDWPLAILVIVIWYPIWGFFAWMQIRQIKTGDAGASGMALKREDHPARFWLRICYGSFWLMILGLMPVALLAAKLGFPVQQLWQ